MNKLISLKIGGAGGQGVKTSGYITTKAVKDLGYWTFSYSEYPSLIRGGHSTYQISISDKKVNSVNQKIDILVALNEETISLHYQEILKDGILLLDDNFKVTSKVRNYLIKNKINIIELTIDEIVKKNNGLPVMANSVITGAIWALITNEYKVIENQVRHIFKEKSKDTEINLKCAKDGFDFVKSKNVSCFNLSYNKTKDRIIGTGNETAGLATFASGCRLYCAYPMTPSTGILNYLAQRVDKFGMIVKQAEDEISAVQYTLGANYAGTRSACGTSGGGFALMVESLALSGITETPLVIFESQRPGPATGMPTWTEQGDLAFLSKAGHGEFPRIILTPGDLDEVLELTSTAFNFSEKYQTPVIVLLDKYLSESWYQIEKFKDSQIKVKRGQILSKEDLLKEIEYKRYKYTVSGISPRSIPGFKKGIFLANSDEHNEKGYSTEDLLIRKQMMEKRTRKLISIKAELPEPAIYGNKNAKTTVICWGSVKGPVLDAVNELNKQKISINLLHYKIAYPVKTKVLKNLAKKNNLIIIENNYSGHLANLIKEETGIDIKRKITKYAGAPFYRDELVDILKNKI